MKLLCLDIEIADVFDLKPGEDLEAYAPFRIAVAATLDSEGGRQWWYSSDAHGAPAASMDPLKARELLEHLQARQAENWMLFAWNGLKFDLRWIGHNAGDLELAGRIALAHYDPMFQFFNQRGFTVSLAAAAEGLGIRQTKLMPAAEAPREWQAGRHQRVMDYVLGDCEMTSQIVQTIAREGEIRWMTKQGKLNREQMRKLKTVAEVLRDPEPDQSWMTGRRLKRTQFTGWLPQSVLQGSSRTAAKP
ncbi:MAG: hypothetical protein FJW34_01220 [Acidobacteria bacterium]|nr:hypothetical protein [Acidobacteriota bacterium]